MNANITSNIALIDEFVQRFAATPGASHSWVRHTQETDRYAVVLRRRSNQLHPQWELAPIPIAEDVAVVVTYKVEPVHFWDTISCQQLPANLAQALVQSLRRLEDNTQHTAAAERLHTTAQQERARYEQWHPQTRT